MGTRKAESTPDVSSHRWRCQRGIGSATRGRARPAQTPDHYCTRREQQAENGGDYGGNPRRRGTKAKRQKETINLDGNPPDFLAHEGCHSIFLLSNAIVYCEM